MTLCGVHSFEVASSHCSFFGMNEQIFLSAGENSSSVRCRIVEMQNNDCVKLTHSLLVTGFTE